MSRLNLVQPIHEFDVANVDKYGDIRERRKSQAKQFVFPLGEDLELALVETPGGRFVMGSPSDELDQRANETPQHEVVIAPFLIGKFTVTQGQWLAVMDSLPQIDEQFRGADLPVVKVS